MRQNTIVLLALFNGQAWLSEQLKSIVVQQNVELDILISNDQSTDNSSSELATFFNNGRYQLTLITPNYPSGSAAQNFFYLFREANFDDYEYVALSDQDDVWDEDKLFHAISAIQDNKVDAYSSNVMAFWDDGKYQLINKAQKQREFDYMFESAGPGCTFVLTKKLAKAIQKKLQRNQQELKEIDLHDWFIYAFSRSEGFKWFIDYKPHMLYRQHTANVLGANTGFNAKLARWKKIRSGWLIQQATLIATILEYNHLWPIVRLKRLNFFDKFILAINCFKFRRRFRDQVAFALSLFFTKKI